MRFILPIGLSWIALGQLHAVEISKENNTNALNLTGSWVGGVVPGSSDIAVFDSTLTTNRSSVIGDNQSWSGIKVTDAGGTLHTINPSTGFTLTLGTSGIDMSTATADLSISAIMDLSASQTWTVGSDRKLIISGNNTGTGTISLAGTGTFALGSNAVFGTGTLNLGDGVTLTSSSASSRSIFNSVNLNGNVGVLMTGASASSITFGGSIDIGAETRVVSVSNANGSATNPTLVFSGGGAAGTNQITGSGVLALENGNGSLSPAVNVRIGISAADFSVVQSDVSVGDNVFVSFGANNVFGTESDLTIQTGGVLNLSNNGGSSVSQTVKSLSGAGTITNNTSSTGTATFTINGGASTDTTAFTGVLQNGATGLLGLTKSGSSTQVLSGANTYTGSTVINGGSLIVDGTHIQSTTGFGYTVNSGGTLGGTGNIARFSTSNTQNAVLVNSGGSIAPGSGGIGTLTLDGVNLSGINVRVLNMASGATFDFELSGNGTSADQVAFWNYVSGDFLLNTNAINLSLTGAESSGTYTVSIFKFYSDSGSSLISSGITDGLTVGTLGDGISNVFINYNSGGSTIDLTYTVTSTVPEPGSWAAILGGFALAAVAVRRRPVLGRSIMR